MLQHKVLALQEDVSRLQRAVDAQAKMLQHQQQQQEQGHQIHRLQEVSEALSAQAQQQQQYAASAASSASTAASAASSAAMPPASTPLPPASRCVHITTGNNFLTHATYSNEESNEVRGNLQLKSFMHHLGSALFGDDSRGYNETWHLCQRAFQNGNLRILWCGTKANRWAICACPHCGSYSKADHGTWTQPQERPRQRANLLTWLGIEVPPGRPTV